jgi:predicted unusual protein kinase regulating ubiquinone biosynthesis (AarF/ABC1/UbiB family)
MSWLRLYLRFVYIALVFCAALVTYGFRRIRLGFGAAPERVELLRGETLAAVFAKLGATFVKLGQILSTRPDLLPPGYITPLARLQDDVPPLPFEVIETVLTAELTPEKRAHIASIEPTPIAAASVAQVHRGWLDIGETVALKIQQPETVGGNRAVLARLGGECVLKMVFTDGFVHADLHPGNIILTPDDRMVLIDLGMVTEIPPDMLRPWLETFVALSQMKGEDCARLFYSHAPTVAAATDYLAFESDVVRFLDGLYGKKLGEVEVSVAVSGMMNVLRKHRVQIDPCFTVVNIALLVAEGLGKQLDPSIDLVPLATPYLADAMLSAPPGRAPLRAVPS